MKTYIWSLDSKNCEHCMYNLAQYEENTVGGYTVWHYLGKEIMANWKQIHYCTVRRIEKVT